MTYARTRNVFGARNWGVPSRFLNEIPAGLTDREEQRPTFAGIRERATSWASGGGAGTPGRGAGVTWSRDEATRPPIASARTSSTRPSATGS